MSSSMTLVRTKADTADDDAPDATLPPEGDVYHSFATLQDAHPIRGSQFKLVFDTPAANTCDVEVWKRNEGQRGQGEAEELASWGLAGIVTGVTSGREYEMPGAGPADLYYRVLNLSGGEPVRVFSRPRE